MGELPPERLAEMMRAAPSMGELGAYLSEILGPFEFEGITATLPTRTFEGRLDLRLGDKEVRLIQVGPAHTRGDVLVSVPHDRTLFTGDILSIDCTPLMWNGPVSHHLFHGLAHNVIDRQLISGLEQVAGHGLAHNAQPDEAYLP